MRETVRRLELLDTDGDDDDHDDHDEQEGGGGDGGGRGGAVLLVTHGACSQILFEVLTGIPAPETPTVGSFFHLERLPRRGVGGSGGGGGGGALWRPVVGGEKASTAHLVELGANAL